MVFEWSVSIGTLVTILTILFTAASIYWKHEYNSTEFKQDIAEIKTDLKQLNKVIMDLALQSQRIDHLEKQIFELRHGKGLVINDH